MKSVSVPFHIFSSGSVERRLPMQSRSEDQVGSSQFYLDPHLVGSIDGFRGLQFPNPPAGVNKSRVKEPQPQHSSGHDHKRLIRAMWATQVCLALVLCLMVFSLLYLSYRLSHDMNSYYEAAVPVLTEVRMRGMSIIQHVDNSSAALEQVMSGAERLTLTSIPALMDSVNRTTSMVARMENAV